MIREGTRVTWSWGSGRGEGTVQEIHRRSITLTLQGSEVTRNGSEDDPAYLIRTPDGAQVLKLRSEVDRG